MSASTFRTLTSTPAVPTARTPRRSERGSTRSARAATSSTTPAREPCANGNPHPPNSPSPRHAWARTVRGPGRINSPWPVNTRRCHDNPVSCPPVSDRTQQSWRHPTSGEATDYVRHLRGDRVRPCVRVLAGEPTAGAREPIRRVHVPAPTPSRRSGPLRASRVGASASGARRFDAGILHTGGRAFSSNAPARADPSTRTPTATTTSSSRKTSDSTPSATSGNTRPACSAPNSSTRSTRTCTTTWDHPCAGRDARPLKVSGAVSGLRSVVCRDSDEGPGHSRRPSRGSAQGTDRAPARHARPGAGTRTTGSAGAVHRPDGVVPAAVSHRDARKGFVTGSGRRG